MSEAERFLREALRQVGSKPGNLEEQPTKKDYSERLSARIAQAFAETLRRRGMMNTRPSPPGEVGASGAERRIAGGISAKKVDVTFATEESGLILALSIKTINFIDNKGQNYQKNLTNRRGDMLFEAVTLHRRFPYSVLAGFLFFDEEASRDNKPRRQSTFVNAHQALRLFTGRSAPEGRDEVYERLYIVLRGADQDGPQARFFEAGDPDAEVALATIFDELVTLVAERNFDMYESNGGILRQRRFKVSQK